MKRGFYPQEVYIIGEVRLIVKEQQQAVQKNVFLLLLRGMWDQMEPVSPALTGRFFTTEPPGKPSSGKSLFKNHRREGSQAG